jgi:hypothetical protein
MFGDDVDAKTASWDRDIRERLFALRPIYAGAAEPLDFSRDRLPREEFFSRKGEGV